MAPRRVYRAYGRVLTVREVEMLGLIIAGWENKEIAVRLGLTEKTVKNYCRIVYAKLGVPNRTAAAIAAYELGVRPPADIELSQQEDAHADP